MKHMYSKLTALGISLLLIIQMFCISPMSVFAQETVNINDTNSVALQNEGTASDFTHINNIVILIRFADQQEYVTPERMTTANKAFNGTSAETDGKSLKSYIDYFSYGALNVDSSFFPYTTNDQGEKTYFSYQDSHPINYYIPYGQYTNPIGYQTNEILLREREFIQDVVNSVKSQVESAFSKEELDTNNDRMIDNLTLICDISNYKSLSSGDLLWSHASNVSGNFFYDLTNMKYNLLNASEWGNFNYSGIVTDGSPDYRTVNHEFLHTMGTKDLYTKKTDKPVFLWDIMANDTGVPRLNEYDRRDVLGWGTKIPIIESSGTKTLQAVQCIGETGSNNTAFILKSAYSNTEFFVIEYHRRTGYEQNIFYDTGGLLIYRINLNKQNNFDGPPYRMYIFRPNESKVQAGYLQSDLQNALLSSMKIGWSSLGKEKGLEQPGFDNQTLYFSNGENSGIVVNNISSNTNDTISFNLTFPNVTPPNSGTGTNDDPFIISNSNQFDFIYCNPSNSYKLSNDIDFSENSLSFKPIKNFSGTFDGNSKKILNFTRNVTRDDDTSSLFDNTTASSIIKNLTFVNPQVTSTNNRGAAVLANTLNGRIENVDIIGGCIECTYKDFSSAGSLAVISFANIYNCSSSANIYNITSYAGGLVGSSSFGKFITSCGFSGTITASVGGGLVGSLTNINIINSSFTGTLNSEYAGGLIGTSGQVNLINSFSNGNVNGTQSTGGIMGIYSVNNGTGSSTIENSYWNTALSNATAAIGSIDNQTVPHREVTPPSGMVGVGIPANLSFNSSSPQQIAVTTTPTDASVTGTWGTTPFYSNVSVSSTGLVTPLYNGGFPVTYTIPVGENQMVLTATASVSNMQDPPKTLITKVDSTYAMLNGTVGRTTMNNGIYTTVKLVNNITMMPVRFLAETMGLTVSWNEAAQSTVITNPTTGEYLMLQIGSTAISKYSQDGTLIASATMPAATTTIESSTYAPARIVAESFGFQVEYLEYANSEIFVITSNRTPAWTAEEIAAMCADASGEI